MNRREDEIAVYVIKRQMEAVAYALRMEALLDARQEKRVSVRLNDLHEYGKQIGYIKDYDVDVQAAKYAKINRLYLNSTKFKAMRKALLQMSQGLPVYVAESASNCSSAIDIDEDNQKEK